MSTKNTSIKTPPKQGQSAPHKTTQDSAQKSNHHCVQESHQKSAQKVPKSGGFSSLDSSTNITSHRTGSGQAPIEDTEDSNHKTITLYCTRCGGQFVAKMRCTDRMCPECAERRINRLEYGYINFIRQRHRKARSVGSSNVGLRFLTLTLKNRDNLKGSKEDIVEYFHKLRRRKPYTKLLKGGIYGFQVTNKGRGWNIHLHIIYEGGFVPQKKVSKDWHDITGDSYVVDIRKIYSPAKALSLILEYCVRPPKNLSISQEAEFNEVMFGKRVFQSWGSWHGNLKLRQEPLKCPRCGANEWISEYLLGQMHMGIKDFLELAEWCREQSRSPPSETGSEPSETGSEMGQFAF